MDNQICPNCGHPTTRDTRPMTLRYAGLSTTFDLPGWYCTECEESVHTGEDMQESDRQSNLLNAQSANVLTRVGYLEQRTQRGDRTKFEQAFAKSPDVPPDAHDLLTGDDE